MALQNRTFVALDCETTGLDCSRDRIIEVSATRFTFAANLAEFDRLVQPEVRVPALVTRITGLTDADLAAAPTFAAVAPELTDFLAGATLIGHNLPFDLGFLAAGGVATAAHPQFDTFDLAALVLPAGGSLSLGALATRFDLRHDSAHRALSDALATRDLFRTLVAAARQLPQQRWEAVARLTVQTEKSWLTDFAALVLHATADDASTRPVSFLPKETAKKSLPAPPAELAATLAELPSGVSLVEAVATETVLASALTTAARPAVLALPDRLAALELAAEHAGIAPFFAPENYPCLVRVAEAATAPLAPARAALVAKLLLAPAASFFQLNLTRVERLLAETVAATACTHADCPLAAPRAAADGAPLIVTDHASLTALAESFPTRRAVVAGSSNLPYTLARAAELSLDLPTLEKLLPQAAEQLTILFGVLGLLLQSAKPTGGRLDVLTATGDKNYVAARETVEHLLVTFGAELPPRVRSMLTTFWNAEPGWVRELRGTAGNDLVLTLAPVENPAAVATLAARFSQTILTDSALSAGDAFAFSLRHFGLPASTPTRTLAPARAVPLRVLDALPDPATPAAEEKIWAAVAAELANLAGHTVVIFGSQWALGQFFTRCHASIPHAVFAEKVTGSRAKILHELARAETAAILTTDSRPLLPASTQQVLLLRLPFRVTAGADFAAETLPRAVLTFTRLYRQATQLPECREFVVADSRLAHKPYGQNFLASCGIA